MRKIAKFFAIILIVCLSLAVLAACNDTKDTDNEMISVSINNEAEFLNLKNMLGDNSKNLVVTLQSDITLTSNDYIPIGDSVENSFRGKLLGNNKSITLNVSELDLTTNVFGVFGYAYNAYFENLSLNVSYEMHTNITSTYIGGLVGFAYGKTSFDNIEAVTKIKLTPDLDKKYSHDNEIDKILIDKVSYVGGVVGYSVGEAEFKDMKAEFDLNIPKTSGFLNEFGIDNCFLSVYSGAIAGVVRTSDISATNQHINGIENAVIAANAYVESKNVYFGSAVGTLYNATVKNVRVKDTMLELNGTQHSIIGGAFSLGDNCLFDQIEVTADILILPPIYPGSLTASTFGGVIGYLNNGASLQNASFSGRLEASLPSADETYGGGVVGVASNAKIKDVTSSGGFVIQGFATAKEYLEFFTVGAGSSMIMVRNFAGIVGRLHGDSMLENAESNFVAYQGIVAMLTSTIKYDKDTIEDKDEVSNVEIDKTPMIGNNVLYYAENTISYYYAAENQNLDDKYKKNDYGQMLYLTIIEEN